MKKTILIIVLTFALIAAFVACSDGGDDTPKKTVAREESTVAPTVDSTEQTTVPDGNAETTGGSTIAAAVTTAPAGTTAKPTATTAKPTATTAKPTATTAPVETPTQPPHTHSWGAWSTTRPATCKAAGEEKHICASCSTWETRPIAAKGHSHAVTETVAATKYEDGYKIYTCPGCNDTYREVLYATGSVGLTAAKSADGKAYAITSSGTCADLEVVIPAIIDGCNVTTIAANAFANNMKITKIVIPATVTKIESGAFRGCSALKEIVVHTDNAIYSVIDGNLYDKNGTTLLQYACGNTATVFAIPMGVTSIGEAAFSGETDLTAIVLTENTRRIGKDAFANCTALSKIYYIGSSDKWSGTTISSGNEKLAGATCVYYAAQRPQENAESYWVYYQGTPTLWSEVSVEDDITDMGGNPELGWSEPLPS